jgi:hypothetical protein
MFYILSYMVYILDWRLSNIQLGIDLHNYYLLIYLGNNPNKLHYKGICQQGMQYSC